MATAPDPPDADPGSFPAGSESYATPTTSDAVIFGRYRVLRELGRGGMGVVLLARDEKLGQPVAIKVVPDNVVQDVEAIDKLRKEVLRGMALTHPGIARTNHFEQDGSGAAIVMEFVEGQTLAQLMKAQPGGCFDAEQLLPWIEQLFVALDYAHGEARLAHRDLKPGNIMITPAGRVKVADFGLASALGDSQSQISIRADGAGTPQYMSPQQFSGDPGNRLDDLYSLGATLYALLTGKPPFFRGNIAALYGQVLTAIPPRMNERRAELGVTGREPIPEAWEETIAACLAKDPAQRPQSAGELLARLKAAGRGGAPGLASARQAELTSTLVFTPPTNAPSVVDSMWAADGPASHPYPHAPSVAAPRRARWSWAAGLVVIGCGVWAGYYLGIGNQTADHAGTTPAPTPLAAATPVPTPHPPEPRPTPQPMPATPAPATPAPATPIPATPVPKPPPITPATATQSAPFVNSLGMKFVPVPQTRVLFCIWETQVRDFAAFADATSYNASGEVFSLRNGEWQAHGDSWRSPGFAQTDAHPVCAMNWFDAVAFCEWLNAHERASGLIHKESYRLPTDKEWTAAAGTGEYPWGERWPPTAEDANIAGREAKNSDTGPKWDVLATHVDPYPRTSPVGSFAPNTLGIFDLGGNVWEWCAEPSPGKADSRIIRGGSWFSFEKEFLRTQYRGDGKADSRGTVRGFRVVLALPPE